MTHDDKDISENSSPRTQSLPSDGDAPISAAQLQKIIELIASDMEARISELQKQIDSMKSTISSHETKISSQETKISSYERRIDSVKSDLGVVTYVFKMRQYLYVINPVLLRVFDQFVSSDKRWNSAFNYWNRHEYNKSVKKSRSVGQLLASLKNYSKNAYKAVSSYVDLFKQSIGCTSIDFIQLDEVLNPFADYLYHPSLPPLQDFVQSCPPFVNASNDVPPHVFDACIDFYKALDSSHFSKKFHQSIVPETAENASYAAAVSPPPESPSVRPDFGF